MIAPELEQKLKAKYPGLLAAVRDKIGDDIADGYAAAYEWLMGHGVDNDTSFDLCMEACFCAMWSRNRIVYHIDSALAQEMSEQVKRMDYGDTLPGELLRRLPYPCIAIEGPPIRTAFHTPTGDIDHSYTGRMLVTVSNWATLGVPHDCLTLLVEADGGKLLAYFLPILGTVGASVEALREILTKDSPSITSDGAKFEAFFAMYASQIILYLQAVNADIERKPAPPRAKSKKAKSGSSAPKPPKEYHVGYHVGAALRRASAASGGTTGTGSAKRPHSRRGHWHNYWMGSDKDGSRRLELKWVAPTIIHGDKSDDRPTVVRVKKGNNA